MRPLQKIRSLSWSRLLPQIGLALLICSALVVNFIWLQLDERLGATADPKAYILNTFAFMRRLKNIGPDNLVGNLQALSFGGRPPLYQLLSMPFIILFGYSMDAGLMINMVFLVLLLISVFKIGQIIRGAPMGLLAAFLAAVYPPLVRLSWEYRPHYAIAACVAFSLWMALLLVQKRTIKAVWRFVLSLGFGILIHPLFAMMFFIPAAVCSLYVIFFQTGPGKPANFTDIFPWLWKKIKDPLFLYGYFPAALLVLGVIVGWYSSFGASLLDSFQTLSSGELADYRGYDVFTFGFANVSTGFFWHLQTMPYAISNVFTAFFGIGVIILLVKHRQSDLLLLISFLGAYIYSATSTTKTWMHFAGILPIMALISVIWLSEIKNKILNIVLLSVLLSAGLFSYYYVNFGGGMNKVAIALSAPVARRGNCLAIDMVFCPSPPDSYDWEKLHLLILKRIKSDPDCRVNDCRVLVSIANAPIANNTLNYYQQTRFAGSPLAIAAMRGPAFKITPFNFSVFLNSSFIVVADKHGRAGIYDKAMGKLLDNPPASFALSHQLVETFRLPHNRRLYLLKRTAPLTLSEAQDVVRSLDLDDKYKFGQYRVLAPLYAQAGQYENALEAYQRALEYEPKSAELYFGLAGVYESLGRLDDAAGAYRKVIELAPETDLAGQAESWLSAR